MRLSYHHVLVALLLTSAGNCAVNKKCAHPGVRDIFRNECAEFVVTAGTDTYGVRLPITASQGEAFIGTMYDDKHRHALRSSVVSSSIGKRAAAQVATSRTPKITMVSIFPSPHTIVEDSTEQDDDDDSSDSDSDSDLDTDSDSGPVPNDGLVFPATSTGVSRGMTIVDPTVIHHASPSVQQSSMPIPKLTTPQVTGHPVILISGTVSSISAPTDVSTSDIAHESTMYLPIGDNVGPGINNVPIKPISGKGLDGKKITYPNKHGSDLCKKARKCVTIGKTGPIVPCFKDLQQKIHELETNRPNMTFAPLTPIACSPSLNSKYCAYIELVPWQANDPLLLDKMNIEPYKNMAYNQVPIGAIREGVDWIKDGKAKMCGAALMPVPEPGTHRMRNAQEKHSVYILKADINLDLPEMDPKVRQAYQEIGGHS